MTGPVKFSSGGEASDEACELYCSGGKQSSCCDSYYRGDRRVGVSYSLLNYQGSDGLVGVGSWTPCGDDATCTFDVSDETGLERAALWPLHGFC